MTTKAEWKEYTGSDEQIAELSKAKNGVCLKFEHSQKSFVYSLKDISTTDGVPTLSNTVTHYLICNPHPLAEMICQQARTGQPVWVRLHSYEGNDKELVNYLNTIYVTTTPDWNIPNTEYSFSEFEKDIEFKEEV